MAKTYDVCIPRPYTDASGKEKTDFWNVGVAFALKERDGFTIKLKSRMLVTDEYVVFAREPREGSASEQEPDDNLPF